MVAQFDRRVSITSLETIQKKKTQGTVTDSENPYATLTAYFGIGLLLSFLEPNDFHSKSSLKPFHFLKIFRAVGLAWLASQLPGVEGRGLRGAPGRDLQAENQHRRLSDIGTYAQFDCSSVIAYSFDYHLPCGDVSWLLNDMSVSEADTYLNSVIPSRLTGNSSLANSLPLSVSGVRIALVPGFGMPWMYVRTDMQTSHPIA